MFDWDSYYWQLKFTWLTKKLRFLVFEVFFWITSQISQNIRRLMIKWNRQIFRWWIIWISSSSDLFFNKFESCKTIFNSRDSKDFFLLVVLQEFGKIWNYAPALERCARACELLRGTYRSNINKLFIQSFLDFSNIWKSLESPFNAQPIQSCKNMMSLISIRSSSVDVQFRILSPNGGFWSHFKVNLWPWKAQLANFDLKNYNYT